MDILIVFAVQNIIKQETADILISEVDFCRCRDIVPVNILVGIHIHRDDLKCIYTQFICNIFRYSSGISRCGVIDHKGLSRWCRQLLLWSLCSLLIS